MVVSSVFVVLIWATTIRFRGVRYAIVTRVVLRAKRSGRSADIGLILGRDRFQIRRHWIRVKSVRRRTVAVVPEMATPAVNGRVLWIVIRSVRLPGCLIPFQRRLIGSGIHGRATRSVLVGRLLLLVVERMRFVVRERFLVRRARQQALVLLLGIDVGLLVARVEPVRDCRRLTLDGRLSDVVHRAYRQAGHGVRHYGLRHWRLLFEFVWRKRRLVVRRRLLLNRRHAVVFHGFGDGILVLFGEGRLQFGLHHGRMRLRRLLNGRHPIRFRRW